MADEYTEEDLTPEEAVQIEDLMKNYGSPSATSQHNVHTFLNKVATSNDTLKTGNLTEIELGMSQLPVRSLKELSLMSDKFCDDELMKSYFNTESEIITASSLSKNAKLISLAVIQKREFEASSKSRKPNTGWFKSKANQPEGV